MIPTQIQNNVVREDTPAANAFYIIKTSLHYPLVMVCDDNDRVVGVIGYSELGAQGLLSKTCGQICNRNFSYVDIEGQNNIDEYIYSEARRIFATGTINVLPVVKNKMPIKLFGRFQAFFLEKYTTLPYQYYAFGLLDAARLAKSRGYDHISAIEFGVASGNGLISMETYAKEVEMLTNVKIDVYGFDSGGGLFAPVDYKDVPQYWAEGDYAACSDEVSKKLYAAKLIIGDIRETIKTFFEELSPPPVGFVSVDVDQYYPTAAILDMFLSDDKYFLPIITMYFDDIFDKIEFQGEMLAIKDFNEKNETIKIAPTHNSFDSIYKHGNLPRRGKDYEMAKMKWCLRFNHPKFPDERAYKKLV